MLNPGWQNAVDPNEVAGWLDLGAPDLSTGLAHYWRPSTTSDATDTVGSLDGTDVGTVTYSSAGADFGTANSNYTTMGNYALASADLTVSIWAKPDIAMKSNALDSFLINNRGNSGSTDKCWQIFYDKSADRWSTSISNGTTSYTASGTSAPDWGNWQHLAITVDDTAKELSFYRDGSLIGSPVSFTGSMLTASYPFAIGTASWDLGNTSTKYHGNYDDARIYEGRVLSSADIAAIYSLGRTAT